MNKDSLKPKKKELTMGIALTVLLILVVVIIGGYSILGAPLHGMFFLSFLLVIGAAYYLGYSYDEIETEGYNFVRKGLQPFFIILAVGGMVGTWMAAGTISTIIYYGLKIITPQFFLLTALVLCSVTSLSTGTSWGAMATAGVAMMGVGQGLDIPPAITAGAVICGAYFGDKMSPFSDTTNLTAAVTGTEVMDHVKHMLYEQVPAYIITAVIFLVMGLKYRGATIDYNSINFILDGFDANFKIGIISFLPALVVVALLVAKIPAFLSLMIGAISGGIVAVLYQGAALSDVLYVFYRGFSIDTGIAQVDAILNRGGVSSMYDTAILILFAMFVSGVLNHIGVMETIINPVLKLVKSEKSLTLVTMFINYFINAVGGSFSLATVMTATFMLPLYEHFNLKSENLSRTIEASGTYGGVLMPWNGHAIYASTTLGVSTLSYVPYCFMNILSPVITIILAFTGISMTRYED
ncbi:MAG: Na+/H+ antiporter NhaC [Tissierellia bacterium]|nr:Na+/H+ antiporter NhaC [Tissierellia bacterium]